VLPPHAIWACIDGQAYQGKLSIESRRALTGNIKKAFAIFVEDEFAKDLVTEIRRQHDLNIFQFAEFHKVSGYPYVIEVLNHHNRNPAAEKKAIAIIDRDNLPLSEANDNVFRLPDGAPESLVFEYIFKNAESVAALVQQCCECPTVSQDKVVEAIKKVKLDKTDHHRYFSKLGNELGFISELIVRRALCSICVENCRPVLADLVKGVSSRLEHCPIVLFWGWLNPPSGTMPDATPPA
jgi:hypothetical protein